MSLRVSGVRAAFGGLVALDNVSLTAEPGAVTALIGPNGAGKTTLFNVISGLMPPEAGSIRLDDSELLGRSARRIAKLGIVRSFQELRLLGEFRCRSRRYSRPSATCSRAPAIREPARQRF